VADPLPWDLGLLAGVFTVSGTVHLVAPRVFEPLVPPWVPAHREVVLVSGVAELVCAAGLLLPATRRLAGPASAALLVAVFPGNLQMALDAPGRSAAYRAATLARLPLQVPLVRTAWRAGRRRPPGSRSRWPVGLA
jgi:uncharacterized membrane protein